MDNELLAVSQCSNILDALDERARERAIRYLADRYIAAGAGHALQWPFEGHSGKQAGVKKRSAKARKARSVHSLAQPTKGPEIAKLVNAFKAAENYEQLAGLVLDESDLLKRIVVALATYRMVNGDADGITSGEVAQFYLQLGVKIGVPNISTALSTRAKQYVISDTVRSKGVIMRYRLSRHGVQFARELGIDATHE